MCEALRTYTRRHRHTLAHTHTRLSTHHAQSIKVYLAGAVSRRLRIPLSRHQHIFRHGNYTNAIASTKSGYWHLRCQRQGRQ